ncbi:MAG TPA: hypothetical protein VFZ72_18160 [Jiangellaceae bacterium]
MDVVVHDRRPVPAGTLLDDRCGGPGEFRWLRADLDADPPIVRSDFNRSAALAAADQVPQAELVPFRLPYELTASDAETFIVRAETHDCDCDWVVVLRWQSQGRTGTIEIDDDGEPFRTVSSDRPLATCDGQGLLGCE